MDTDTLFSEYTLTSANEIINVATGDYNDLINKPSINGNVLVGDKTLEELGIDIPTRTSELINDGDGTSNFATEDYVNQHGGSIDSIEVNGVEQPIVDKTVNIAVPVNTSDLINDSGFITSEVDPTVPSWAKQPNKPDYTASEVGALPDDTFIPSNTSDLVNDSGFITSETDPTVPEWAKQPNKPTYTASEVGALSSDTFIPSKTSDLTNDSGFITSADVPTKTSDLINDSDFITSADIPAIPSKTSDLTNDSGFITSADIPDIPAKTSDLINDSNFVVDANYVHTDNNFTTTLKNKLDGVAAGAQVNVIEIVKENGTVLPITNKTIDITVPTKTSDLNNDSGFITGYTETDPVYSASPSASITSSDISNWNNKSDFSGDYEDLINTPDIPDKTSDLINDSGFISEWVHDLGDFSMEDYDWDFGEYLNDIGLVESGFYKAHDTIDEFDYYTIVERAGNEVYQEYWSSEDSSTYRQIRSGYYDGESWSFNDWDNYMTSNNAYDSFALKNHSHYIEETVNYSNILTYFDTFNQNKQVGQYKIINSSGKNVYYLTYDYRYISGLSGGYRLYQEYVTNADNRIHIRFGTRSGNSIVWGAWRNYIDENEIFDNVYNMDYIDDTYYTKEEVDDLISGGGGGGGLIATTWANLVELRDNAELVKGAYYRITDYNFVTTKLGVQSGNHQFDIVVLAISESMLSESAYAVKHAGDHYFEREVTEGGIEWLYTLYVDDYGENYGNEPMNHQDDLHSADEFCDSGVLTHPDTGDDVPVLYKTDTGEYDIDDPDYDDTYFYEGIYELDGDEYDMWSKYERDPDTGDWVFMQQYALTPIVVEDGELVVSPIPETKIVPVNMNAWELKYCLDNDKDLFDWAETDGKGVIYYLKDEFGNEAPYDFKNAMFRRYQVSSASYSVLNNLRNLYLYLDGCFGLNRNDNIKYWYTFASADGITDGSLFGECTYNTIKPYVYLSSKGKNIKGLNNIVLQNANRNELGYNCYDITLLTIVSDNKLYYCRDICGQAFSGNEIMANCYALTFDRSSNCHYGDGTRSSYGRSVDAAKTGSGCMEINFGDSCSGIELANSCRKITFGQWCYSNSIGSGCSDITMGNYCSYIDIGKLCLNITFTNYYRYIDIEDNVSSLTFTTTGGNTSTYVQYVKVCKGVNNKQIAPTRRVTYEQIYYTIGRIENAV